MFTLVGWSEAQAYGATYAAIAALPDPHVRVEGVNVIVPADLPYIGGLYGVGANLTAVRVDSPSLRRVSPVDISYIDAAAEPSSPGTFEDRFTSPIPVVSYEPLRALTSNNASSGTTRVSVLTWLTDGPQVPVSGDIYTVMATSSTTLTAYAWTNGALTFSQVLPAGRYQVVGMVAQSAGLIAARLLFVGGKWRPGCLCRDSVSDVSPSVFRFGRLGVWGEFNHDAPPTVDFLSSSADSSEIVWLDLIKVG
ncbi:hypothetical protein [Chloroflexus sp.]|uniref:hypothetical protein n=1 Tax=Chloroflexus sp. TaxID=1904827 RepID=UPI003C7204FB